MKKYNFRVEIKNTGDIKKIATITSKSIRSILLTSVCEAIEHLSESHANDGADYGAVKRAISVSAISNLELTLKQLNQKARQDRVIIQYSGFMRFLSAFVLLKKGNADYEDVFGDGRPILAAYCKDLDGWIEYTDIEQIYVLQKVTVK